MVTADRLREILRREAELYAQAEEIRLRQQGANPAVQWSGAPEGLHHEKDALRVHYGDYHDPLRPRNVHAPFRRGGIHANPSVGLNQNPSSYADGQVRSVDELQLCAIDQELEKLIHEKSVLTESDANRRVDIQNARQSIKRTADWIKQGHDDISLQRAKAQQLLEKLQAHLQLYRDL